MFPLLIFIVLTLLNYTTCDKLNVAYEWKKVDFDYPSIDDRQNAILRKQFIPENNLPLGLEVHKNRLFVTVPRWKYGVPASLTYIDRSQDPQGSPKLKPYPSWEAHESFNGQPPEIVSPFRIRADQCNRLWVLDTGYEGVLEKENKPEGSRWIKNSTLLIYDLESDVLLRSYTIPMDQQNENSFFANIAVEDESCEDTFAYLADLGGPGLVTYSFKQRRSWLVKNNYFHIKPLAGEMNVSNITFQWTDGLFGLALRPEQDGFSTLFFHPLTSFDEFSVSTKILRDEYLATDSSNFHEFKYLGSRGPKSQSGAEFIDKKTNVLFYALVHLNAVACWRTTNPNYTMESQGRIYMNNITMVFPNDVKVDIDGNLWVLSNRLPTFMYSILNDDEVNFRIMTAKVTEAIRGTACASKLNPDPNIMNQIVPIVEIDSKFKSGSSSISCLHNVYLFMILISIFINLVGR